MREVVDLEILLWRRGRDGFKPFIPEPLALQAPLNLQTPNPEPPISPEPPKALERPKARTPRKGPKPSSTRILKELF